MVEKTTEVIKIEISGSSISATVDDVLNGVEYVKFNYDEESAIGLAVDLLARLILTQEVENYGITVSPANDMEINLG